MPAFLENLNLAHISGQVGQFTGPQQLFVLLVLLFIFLYGLSVGKTRAIISLLGIYIAFMLTSTFPYVQQLYDLLPWKIEPHLLSIGIFLVLYLAVFYVLNHSALKSRMTMGEMSFSKVLIVSIFQVAFLGAILLSFIPQDALPKGLSIIHPFLGTQQALFFWAAASLAVLPFMKEGKRKSLTSSE